MAAKWMLVPLVLLACAAGALAAPRDCTRRACRDEVAVTCSAAASDARRQCAKAIRTHCRAGACSCAVAGDIGKTGTCACPAGEVCRPPVSICDGTEVCTGTSPDCPPDLFVIVDFIPCREAAGEGRELPGMAGCGVAVRRCGRERAAGPACSVCRPGRG